jgi:GTP cyclohydrolase I
LSGSAFLRFELEWPLLKPALLSDLKGWRQYPVIWQAEVVGDKAKWTCGFEVLYSSTCPCSTALAEQLLEESLATEEHLPGSVRLPATPHAQRSRAQIWMEFGANALVPGMEALVHQAEEALGTPVQTAVKRIDEQEFARRNALHLMFCEDAARKLKAWLESQSQVIDYWVEVRHEESLHAHDAVARFVKGRPEGFRVSQKP